MKTLLCLILLLSLYKNSSALYNWTANPDSSNSGSVSSWGNTPSDTGNITNTTYGTYANAFDNDMATFYGIKAYTTIWSHLRAKCIVTSEFNEAEDIDNMVIKIGESGYGTRNYAKYSLEYYDTGWHFVANGTAFTGTSTVTSTTGWTDVNKVRLTVEVYYEYITHSGHLDTYAYIYELQAFGTRYDDIGLRFKNSTTTVNVGVQDLDGHKLRVRKGNTTYGIPLIVPGSDGDANIKIYDGSDIKSIPEAT